MKAPYIKDKQNRKNFLLQEEKLRCLKTLKINQLVHCKWWARHKLDCFLNQSYKNRCIITKRGRSTNQAFKLSRLEFRRWALATKLPGVQKGSW
jgi:ribosomal protein S14